MTWSPLRYRKERRLKPDHPEADCPMMLLLDRLADKWAVLAVAALRKGPLRFNALKRAVGGV